MFLDWYSELRNRFNVSGQEPEPDQNQLDVEYEDPDLHNFEYEDPNLHPFEYEDPDLHHFEYEDPDLHHFEYEDPDQHYFEIPDPHQSDPVRNTVTIAVLPVIHCLFEFTYKRKLPLQKLC